MGSSAPSLSLGVGNGGIWENHLCAGDVHGAGVVGARERLSSGGRKARENGSEVSQGSWRGPACGFKELASNSGSFLSWPFRTLLRTRSSYLVQLSTLFWNYLTGKIADSSKAEAYISLAINTVLAHRLLV